MAGARSTNTFSEFLQRMLSDIAQAKVLPDSDLEFLVNLETQVVQAARAPLNAMQAQGTTGVPPMGMGGGMPGMGGAGGPMGPPPSPMPMPPGAGGGMPPMPTPMPMPPPGVPSGVGGGVPGLRTEPAAPNPDELRRMLSQ